METPVHIVRLTLLLLASIALMWLRTWLIIILMGKSIGPGGQLTVTLSVAFSSVFAYTLLGLWRQHQWTSNSYFWGGLPLVVCLIIALANLWRFHWGVYPILLAELYLVLWTMVSLARVPKNYWIAPTKGWRSIFRGDRISLVVVLLACLELGLFIQGFRPGKIDFNPYFKEVSELIIWEDYTADQYSLTHLSTAGAELARTGTWAGEYFDERPIDAPFSFSTHSIFEDWTLLRQGASNLPFALHLQELLARPDSVLEDIDQAHLTYLEEPINADGYRSIPFKQYKSGRPSVLLLGDSFTFGWSARPWFGAFADHLRTMGYVVYNAGITATGPDQYAGAAERFIPELLPDHVIVNFYMGNDIMDFPIEPKPFEMVYYPTNAGIMMAYPGPERLRSPEEAYQYLINQTYIVSEDWISRLCKTTIIGTLAWKAAQKSGLLYWIGIHPNSDYRNRNQVFDSPRSISEDYLLDIQALAHKYGAGFHCVIIPDLSNTDLRLERDHPKLFNQIDPFVAPVSPADYHQKEAHLNLQGHQRYAELLDSLMNHQ